MLLKKHYVRFLFVLLLIINCGITFAQIETADLAKKLKKAQAERTYRTDTANVLLLDQLSDQYVYDNADSALVFAKQAMQLAEFQKFKFGQAISWNRLGKVYYVLGDYSASLNAAASLMNISSKIGYQAGMGNAYQIMGLIYMSQNNYPESVANFNKALKIFTLQKNDAQIGKVYFNLGVCYDESGKTLMAFYYLNKAIAIANKGTDNNFIAMTLNRAGEIYFHIKNYDKALEYYTKVANSKTASKWEKDFAMSGIAQCYYETGRYDLAVVSAEKSYGISIEVNSGSDAIRALEILSKSYAAKKDYKKAYDTQVLLKKSTDSLFNSEKEKEVNYLHLKQQQADNKRLQNEIDNKEQSITYSKRLLFFRNMIAVAVTIIFVIIFINNRQKTALNKLLKKQNEDIAVQKEEISRQKEVLDQLNNTKDQIFAVISHDLRSPFASMLQSIEAIRSGDFTASEQNELLEGFYQQVNLVTAMVNNLLVWANSQQTGIKSIPVILEVTQLVSEIISVSAFLAKNKNITITHQYHDKKFVIADADHVKIIIQNLTGNAIKFTGDGGAISINYSDNGAYLAIHVKDTGIGISDEKMGLLFKVTGKEISGYGTNNEAGAGIGLAIIKQFTDANNGRIEVKSKFGNGSEFIVYLPKA